MDNLAATICATPGPPVATVFMNVAPALVPVLVLMLLAAVGAIIVLVARDARQRATPGSEGGAEIKVVEKEETGAVQGSVEPAMQHLTSVRPAIERTPAPSMPYGPMAFDGETLWLGGRLHHLGDVQHNPQPKVVVPDSGCPMTDGSRTTAALRVRQGYDEGGGAGSARAYDVLETPEGAALRQEGDYWTLTYQGSVGRLKDMRGLHYLAHLLRHPGQEFHVLDLMRRRPQARQGEPELRNVLSSETRHPLLDDTAKAAYRRRLEDLREHLAEAEQFNDIGRADQARQEIHALTQQLAAAVGLGGRDRSTRTAAERARAAVTQRLRAAIRRIALQHAALAAHLSARVRTGRFCVYRPDAENPISWEVGESR